MRWSALRGRALDEAAAALLEYFDAAKDTAAFAVPGGAAAPAQAPVRGVQWADFGAETPMRAAAAAEEKAAAIGRELLQMRDGGAEALQVLQVADETAQKTRSGFLPQRMDALRGAQQEMDEISEFFRRDSRRYDNGFSGGYGL